MGGRLAGDLRLAALALAVLPLISADPTGLCPAPEFEDVDCRQLGCGEHGMCLNATGRCACATGYWVPPHAGAVGCTLGDGGAQAALLSFSLLGLLLMLGKLTRVYASCLHFLYLPSSVIGGLYGLVLLQALSSGARADMDVYWTSGWNMLPQFLINIVFAALFLGERIPGPREVWKESGPNLMYGMATAWIQMLVGFVLTWALLVPAFDVNPLFAQTLPIGFAGGHGTAAALSAAFTAAGFPDGGTISLASATVGIIAAVTIGIVLVNLAVARGWVQHSRGQTAGASLFARQGIADPEGRELAGTQTTTGDSIDSLAWHLVIVGIACLLGWSLRAILIAISPEAFCTFPLFSLCMMAGLAMQLALQRYDVRYRLVDRATMERIQGTALDFLIVAAVASVNVASLAKDIVPFLLLMVAGLVTDVLCVLYLSPLMNPTYWFENGIACFGQDTGVIAAGLMLLRMVDPEGVTGVPRAFGYKQPVHAALMGGGIATAAFIPLQASIGLAASTCVTATVVGGIMLIWLLCIRPQFAARRSGRAAQGVGRRGSSISLKHGVRQSAVALPRDDTRRMLANPTSTPSADAL